MGIEIERKFLVCNDSWRQQVVRSIDYRQGYLCAEGNVSVRVRIAGEKANINLKSATVDITRIEYEYPIPVQDAKHLLGMAIGTVIEKTRHLVDTGQHTWEIDIFGGANSGLVIAEIELQSPDEQFERPNWAGAEVSGDPRYFNACLALHPYRDWD